MLRRPTKFMVQSAIYDLLDVTKAEPRITYVFHREREKAWFTRATLNKKIDQPSAAMKEIAICGDRERNRQRVEYDVEQIEYKERCTTSISYCW